MHAPTFRMLFGCCSLVLTAAACSSDNAGAGVEGSGGTSSMASAGTAAVGGKGSMGKPGPVAMAGEGGDMTATGGSGMVAAAGTDAQGEAGATTGSLPQVVGKKGGVVMQEGVTLDIPANALTTDVPITVMSGKAPAGYELVSEVFQFGPDGTTFAQPVAVTIPLLSAATNAHVFWSNASNGFDDIGGTVNGLSATAYVTHFSRGFAAVPMHEGSGGAGGDSAGGAPGAAGMGGTDVGGTGGVDAGGTSGGDAGGSGGVSGGSGGTSGGGTGGSGGMSGGGAGGSGGGSALCNNQALNLPIIKVTNVVMGSPPDSSTYTGGSLPSGNYLENGVTHYGPLAYSGPQQAQYKIDPVAQTIQIGERMNASTFYIGMTYTVTDPHTLHATVVCNTTNSPSTIDYAYTYTVGNPSKLTMTAIGSLDVMTFIAP